MHAACWLTVLLLLLLRWLDRDLANRMLPRSVLKQYRIVASRLGACCLMVLIRLLEGCAASRPQCRRSERRRGSACTPRFNVSPEHSAEPCCREPEHYPCRGQYPCYGCYGAIIQHQQDIQPAGRAFPAVQCNADKWQRKQPCAYVISRWCKWAALTACVAQWLRHERCQSADPIRT